MANTTTESAISNTISASGRSLLADITHDTVWFDVTLQYYLGNGDVLAWDTEFRDAYLGDPDDYYSGSPDAAYAYTTQTERAFEMIDSVIFTDFERVTNAATAQATADLVYVTSVNNDESLEGFHQLPPGSTRAAEDFWGFSTFTSDQASMNVAPEVGGGEYLNWTLIHEIGHGLGLLHPFSGDPSVTRASVGAALDNERYTVMSYDGATDANAYGHAVTLMALDIAALQEQYFSETYAEGNSTYSLFDAQAEALRLNEGDMHIGRAYATIWDSGGTDTLEYGSSANSVLINLNDATLDRSAVAADAAPSVTALQHTDFFSSLAANLRTEITDSNYNAGGFFSRVLTETDGTFSGIDGGFAIAHGVDIENAIGGQNEDLLIGNEEANTLTGNDGNDVLIGGGGNDTLDGGEGCDIASFSEARANYTITDNEDGTITVAHNGAGVDGSDTLVDVEQAQFSDELTSLGDEGALEFTTVTSNSFVTFGNNVLYRNDDGSQSDVDITSIFEDGITVGDTTYTTISVNTNGNVTFGGSLSTYTPSRIEGSGRQIVAPYWADVDTRNPSEGTNPGNVYWDFDTDRDSFIVTWDNVGYYSRHVDLLSSFQLEMMDRGCGNIEIIFRYGDIAWTAGDASGGENGVGGTTSRAGFSLGETYFELPASGNEPAMLSLESLSGNLGVAGVWQFIVSGGFVQGVGGEEDDDIPGTDGDDNVLAGQGNDTVRAGDGDDSVFGGQGNDSIDGGDGDDVLDGGSGVDTIIGGRGNDTIADGGTDDDLYDVIYGGEGDDDIDGGFGNDSIRGDAGNDVIAGGFGADTVIGGTGNDTLTGSAYSDQLFGGDGDDFINGGWGHDRVNGGDGADRFFHIGIFDHGSDWIQDYDASEGDVLVFGIGSATPSQFQVNTTHTADSSGNRSGDDSIEEAFVIYRPTGQIMWALVDGAGQSEINLQIAGQVYDLLA
ncbi:nidogen-like domain-containing protein [Shimia thalassica]|uniref:nidogen-like domain-containing protein n=1 Tax=Shimia thalassica TaxID=1715693 RepID=UPI0026E33642|nr:nidogen-like domain-containing protein [Shimia thalassica]MDO6799544.1 M10 family metallopeptidase C-terminal domain-containing protein [Shimia thalassica]